MSKLGYLLLSLLLFSSAVLALDSSLQLTLGSEADFEPLPDQQVGDRKGEQPPVTPSVKKQPQETDSSKQQAANEGAAAAGSENAQTMEKSTDDFIRGY